MSAFLAARCGVHQSSFLSPGVHNSTRPSRPDRCQKIHFPRKSITSTPRHCRWNFGSVNLIICSSSADLGANNQRPEPDSLKIEESWSNDENNKNRIAQLALAAGALIGMVTLVATAVTWASGGPTAFIQAVAKSGFAAAFALIFVSEIGDKTFFIAALLAMRHSKSMVLFGASTALAIMTIISVAIGRIFHAVPSQLKTTLPIGEYAAVALLVFFGFKALKDAWDMPSSPSKDEQSQTVEMSELTEAEEVIKKSEVSKSSSPFEVFWETFSLVFLAEWGDRSMLATIALGAAQAPLGVASGAIVGHVIATGLAVLGGAFLAQYISEKMVSYIGGVLFLAFAAATLLGVF